MKLLILPFFVSISLFAQIDTTNWYPLQVGNYWEYKTNDGNWAETYEVVKDTIMPNGKSYAMIKYSNYNNNSYSFQRVEDNAFVYYYDLTSNTEYKYYDFMISINQYWDYGRQGHLRFLEFNSDYQNELFGTTLNIKKFVEHKFIPDTVGFTFETIAKGVGPIVYGWYTGYDEKDSTTLVGAIIDGIQYGQITWTKKISKISTGFSLQQNYPNPFNPTTVISYSLPKNALVHLKVFDMLGREVANLVNNVQSPGNYKVTFNGSNLPSGVYFYKIESDSFTKINKMLLLR